MPGTYNISHYKGDTRDTETFVYSESSVAVDITGYSILMQVRASEQGPLVAEFSSEGGHFTITDASNGTFTLDEQIIDIASGVHVYDLQLTSPLGKVITLLKGTFTVTQDITNVN